MVARTFPVADGASSEADWTLHQAADGILSDSTGASLAVTADGSSTDVTVADLADHAIALVRGVGFDPDGSTVLALGSIGTQPTAGQTRIDRIVLRLDRSTSPYVVTVEALPGTPASSGAAAPAVTRDATTWEWSLATVTRTGTSAVTQAGITDERVFVGYSYTVPAAGPLPGFASLGDVVTQGTRTFRRRLVSGVPSWQTVSSRGVRWAGGTPISGPAPSEDDEVLVREGIATVTFDDFGVGRIDLTGFSSALLGMSVQQVYDSAFTSPSSSGMPLIYPSVGVNGSNKTRLVFVRRRTDKTPFPGTAQVMYRAEGY